MHKQSPSQKAFLLEAASRYHNSLENSPAADYLKNRGLTYPSIKETVQTFKLGFVAEPLTGHEAFRGFLAIPYRRWSPENGWTVVSIRFRCIQDHEHVGHGKYMTVAGDRPRLYNTPALLKTSPSIAITEGEIDAITATACGVPAVGVPGAQAWQEHFREPFLGYRDVFVLADGDEAGRTFADTIAATLPNSKVIPCPPGEDVNSLVLSQNKTALLERIK